MNKLLERQLKRNKVDYGELPENIQQLLDNVSQSYDHQEIDRSLIERSTDLSSEELNEANKKLRLETDRQKVVLANLKSAILSLSDHDKKLFASDGIEDKDLISVSDFLANQIQKRKDAENKLKLYQRAINSSSNGILITDPNLPDNPLVFCNPAFLQMTGYTEDDVLGKNCRFLQGEDRNQEGLLILRNAIKEKKSCVVILKNFKKNGTSFWNELKISPIFNSDGDLTHFIGIQSDITDQMFIENQLRESNARISKLLQNITSGIMVADEQRRIALVNSEFCKMFGILVNPETLIGTDCSQSVEISKSLFVCSDFFVTRIEEILIEKKMVKDEELLLTDGRVFERDYIPIFVDDKYKGHLWNYRDVTFRKKAEQELLDSKQQLDSVLNTVGEGIITITSDSTIIMINDEIAKIWGYSKEELVGEKIHILMPEYLRGSHDAGMKRYKESKSSNVLGNRVELEGMKKDRSIFPMEIKIQETKIKELTYFTAAVSDISERKKTQLQLTELKAFYEQTLNDLSGQVAVFDSDFRYIYVNPSSVTNKETRQWIIGKDDYEYCEFRGIDKSFADQRRKWLIEVKNQKKQIRFEEEFKMNNGTIRFFERKISPILNSNNEVIRLIAYGVDITEIKSLVKNLEYSNKALTDFAYVASHDLREPLRKISTFGSLLNKSLTGKLDEDDKENLDFMIDGAKRMQQIVDDLLYYSRITVKAKSYSLINLDELLDEIINFDLAQMIADNNAKIFIENNFGSIKGEKTQIKQLFQNLIGNGIKYRKKSINPIINIRSKKSSFKIEVQVEDNGIGIDEKYKDQIFEMFKRLHSKSEYEGSGIGLAICKKIIELYDGEIKVESKPDLGSTFIFSLPVKELR